MPSTSTASVRNILRRFRGNDRGSAALEFALIAPVFIGLLFAILETALVFFADQVLETAAQDSARVILTGQAQSASYTPQQFQAEVCSHLPVLFGDCSTPDNVYIDVQSYAAFTNVNIASQIDASGNFVHSFKYCPGNAGDIVVVRLFYLWPLVVAGFGGDLSNLAGHTKRLLTATAAFRNEPFTAKLSPCVASPTP